MDLKELKDYITTSRIALTTKCTDPINSKEIHTLLQNLRQYLSCRVCHKLPDQLNHYADGFACTLCVNSQMTEDTSSVPVSTIKQCYMKLCAYIQTSPLYDAICACDENKRMVDLMTEGNGVSHSINGFKHFVNGTSNKQQSEIVDSHNNIDLNLSNIQLPIENDKTVNNLNLQVFDVKSPKHKIQNQTIHNTIHTKKKKTERRGCRCGKTISNPGKLTCFGQRCPCYTEQKPCDLCKCRGCRNPRQKPSNNDNNLDMDKIRRKPVTLLSSLNPSLIKSKPTQLHYTMHNMLQFPSHSQGGPEVTLGQVAKQEQYAFDEVNHEEKEELSIELENLTSKQYPKQANLMDLEEISGIENVGTVVSHNINTIKIIKGRWSTKNYVPCRKSARVQKSTTTYTKE